MSRAAKMARSGSSSWATGAPKNATLASQRGQVRGGESTLIGPPSYRRLPATHRGLLLQRRTFRRMEPEEEATPTFARLSSTGRVEAFSDGVMAIAITLLVLDLRVPTEAQVSNAGGLLEALLVRWPPY